MKVPTLNEQGFMEHWSDLKKSHRGTYWMLKKYLKRIEAIKQDADGNPYQHPDIGMVKDAMSDNSFAVGWLHTGKRPGNKRGIERRSAYQKEKLMDPTRMQAFVSKSSTGSPANLTDNDSFRLGQALQSLSDRERECYEMAHGQGFSLRYIANLLGISKGAVGGYVKRAQEKVSDELRNNMFL